MLLCLCAPTPVVARAQRRQLQRLRLRLRLLGQFRRGIVAFGVAHLDKRRVVSGVGVDS